MTDERVRELERRWQGTRAAEDEAAWLRERARLGRLEPEALTALAHLGSQGARALVEPLSDLDPEAWGNALVDAGRPVALRAVAVAAGVAVTALGKQGSRPLEQLLEALRAQVRDGRLQRNDEVLALLEEARRAVGGPRMRRLRQESVIKVVALAWEVSTQDRKAVRRSTLQALSAASAMVNDRALQEAVAAALVPWLRSNDAPLDPDAAPTRLLTIEKFRYMPVYTPSYTYVWPEVELDPTFAQINAFKFRVEVRRGDGTSFRCRAIATNTLGWMIVLLGLRADELQPGWEVWEVGP